MGFNRRKMEADRKAKAEPLGARLIPKCLRTALRLFRYVLRIH